MASADFMEGGVEDVDDDLDDRSHKKLLNAVSSLYRKQRIAAPKRNEPSLQISEFNLAKTVQKKKLAPTELLKGLSAKPIHQQLHEKIKNVKRKLKPLPKPLEKFEAEKITRETGYETVTKEVSKWDATIERNRAADQLVFPLRGSGRITMEPERDILATFSKPTELELKMAEVLNKSSVLKELKEEAQAEKMTLGQLIQRRNMVAKMRHRESYRIAKAVRQNKIKSKKYHRLLKRDKIKNELKEFELLQKTDPEAALAKLERIERARAEERISLRHRNTGKWAKGLAIRAKYDTEARAQLSDNLRKSRDLTEKVKASMVSDSESEGDDAEMELGDTGKSTINPWVNSENEVSSFVEGYRKFWEEQNKSGGDSKVGVGMKKKERSKTVSSEESVEASESDDNGRNEVNFGAKGSKKNVTVKEGEEFDVPEEDEEIVSASDNENGCNERIGHGSIEKEEIQLQIGNHEKIEKESASNVVHNKHRPGTTTSDAAKLSNEKPKLRKINKKLLKSNYKRAAISRIVKGKTFGEKKKIKRKSVKSVNAGKPACRSKSKIQFRCFEKPVNRD